MITSKDFKKQGGLSGAARQPAIDRKIREEQFREEVRKELYLEMQKEKKKEKEKKKKQKEKNKKEIDK